MIHSFRKLGVAVAAVILLSFGFAARPASACDSCGGGGGWYGSRHHYHGWYGHAYHHCGYYDDWDYCDHVVVHHYSHHWHDYDWHHHYWWGGHHCHTRHYNGCGCW